MIPARPVADRPDTHVAEATAEDARRALADVEARIGTGDPNVTTAHLRDARAEVEYAALAVSAAHNRDANRNRDERHAYYDAVAHHAASVAGRPDELCDAIADAITALRKVWQAAAERHQAVTDTTAAVNLALAIANEAGDDTAARDAGLLAAGHDGYRVRDTTGHVHHVTTVTPAHVATLALATVFNQERDETRRAAYSTGQPWRGITWDVELDHLVTTYGARAAQNLTGPNAPDTPTAA